VVTAIVNTATTYRIELPALEHLGKSRQFSYLCRRLPGGCVQCERPAAADVTSMTTGSGLPTHTGERRADLLHAAGHHLKAGEAHTP